MSVNSTGLIKEIKAEIRQAWRTAAKFNASEDETETMMAEAAARVLARKSRKEVDNLEEVEALKEQANFMLQMCVSFHRNKLHDFDTNWRMADKILPTQNANWRQRDASEISGGYRKIHLSDILFTGEKLANAILSPKAAGYGCHLCNDTGIDIRPAMNGAVCWACKTIKT